MKKRLDVAPQLWDHDKQIAAASGWLAGIDEVGRGPLAGNVVAACVLFDLSQDYLPGLNDSKKLTATQREAAFPKIRLRAIAYGIGEASPEEIDKVNILQATFLAMRRALESLPQPPDLLLVDGNHKIPGWSGKQITLVGGDGLSASIAAASILAKVTRDASMQIWDEIHPEYGFAKHKGYGTATHCESIRRYGLTPIHRRSFCSAFAPESLSLSLF